MTDEEQKQTEETTDAYWDSVREIWARGTPQPAPEPEPEDRGLTPHGLKTQDEILSPELARAKTVFESNPDKPGDAEYGALWEAGRAAERINQMQTEIEAERDYMDKTELAAAQARIGRAARAFQKHQSEITRIELQRRNKRMGEEGRRMVAEADAARKAKTEEYARKDAIRRGLIADD